MAFNMEKIELVPFLTLSIQMNSVWIKCVKMKTKNLKLLEENTGDRFITWE